MARNFIFFCSPLRTRSYFSLQSVLLNRKVYFSDQPSKKSNLYETLGIPSNATQNEIKKAYYDLTLRYHPDRNENCEVAATKFREATEAYEILGNFGLRKKYDKGVPVSLMRKSIKAAPIDHKVKYQEFFDSRSSKNKYSGKSIGYDNYKERLKDFEDMEKTREEARKAAQERPSTGVQFAILMFFLILIYVFKF